MILLLSIALYFVYSGGQIAVIIADFFQGIFAMFVLLIVVLYLFFTVSWSQVSEALEETPLLLAQEEIIELKKDKDFLTMDLEYQKRKIEGINERYENTSKINPFKTSHVEDFNIWYFLIGIIGVMYGSLSWQ